MSNVISLDVNGNTVTIDSKVFLEYSKRAYSIQQQIADLNQEFKDEVESAADGTGLEKKDVSRYFKARFKAETKKPKLEGELFSALDEILVG